MLDLPIRTQGSLNSSSLLSINRTSTGPLSSNTIGDLNRLTSGILSAGNIGLPTQGLAGMAAQGLMNAAVQQTMGAQMPNMGMQQGFNNGMQQGFNNGMQQGFNNGMQQGFNNGMQQGFNNGMQQNFNNGMQQGFNNGMQQDFNNGMQQGFNNGVQPAPTQGHFVPPASSQTPPVQNIAPAPQPVQNVAPAPQPVQNVAPAPQPAAPVLIDKPVPAFQKQIQKGQKVPLSSGAPLTNIKVLLGWNTTNPQCELDVSAYLLGANGKVLGDDWFVFYGQELSPDGSTKFSVVNDPNDRELIQTDFNTLNPAVEKIVYVLTINEAMEKNLNFSMVKDGYIRIFDTNTNTELVSYMMADYYPNVISMMLGEVYKHNGAWKFNAVGNGVAKDLAGLCELYGVQVI